MGMTSKRGWDSTCTLDRSQRLELDLLTIRIIEGGKAIDTSLCPGFIDNEFSLFPRSCIEL